MLDRLSQQQTVDACTSPARSRSKDHAYAVTVCRGADNVANALHALSQQAKPLTLFQSTTWLEKSYQHLAPAYDGAPMLVTVRRGRDDALIVALPLVVVLERGHRAAGFPDFGLSDYGAPLVSSAGNLNFTDQEITAIWKSVCRALSDIDRLSLTNMPCTVAGRPNPLARVSGVIPSTHARYVVSVDGTVDNFLVSRGKKYRKEVERCFRLLAERGAWHFQRAQTSDEITSAFNTLESLQSERWQGEDGGYGLRTEVVARFYTEVLRAGDDTQGAQIFTLRCADETIAVLYGVRFDGTFTLLRIASASGAWRRLSPGRLIVIEAMRHFAGAGVTSFDLGIGDYAFKRGLGAKAHPLVDIEQALSWTAKPHVMLMQAKGWLRRYPRLLQMAKAARQKMSR